MTMQTNETEIVEIHDETGWDLCECVKGGTRVLRVLESHHVHVAEDRTYAIQYAHACGYRD